MLFAIYVLALVLGQCFAEDHPWIPKPRDEEWLRYHERLINQTLEYEKSEQIIFIGDSITEGWSRGNMHGNATWHQYYAPRHAYNYGIGGDRVENVLYRIVNNEFKGLKPKVTVLMIGTNNLVYNSIEDIDLGIKEVIKQVEATMPSTKILLLPVIPRTDDKNPKIIELNALIKKCGNYKSVFFWDMWSAFLTPDHKQNTSLYWKDGTHPNDAGYKVWYETMEPLLLRLLGEGHPWIGQPKATKEWMERHESFLNMTVHHKDEERIVFIGDSITDWWSRWGNETWDKYYAPRHAFNYGIHGDRTEHVLFRIENKEFDGLKPNVTVLMIGTNNLNTITTTTEDVAKGVKEILRQISEKMSSTKIILLGVLPKGPKGERIPQLNSLIKEFADEKTVFWLDMWSKLANSDGHQKTELFNDDKIHLNSAGYEVWYETMEPLLERLLN